MLSDSLGRTITYLRLSVTDRCDLRCTYCMAEKMKFSPKVQILTLEDLADLAEIFIGLGVRKLRITGGEPLVRRNVMSMFRRLGARLGPGPQAGLDELTLTTNGTMLARYAAELADCGVRRVNVSLDTLDRDKYAQITRGGSLRRALGGIAAAVKAGLGVKINMVALKQNVAEVEEMVEWAARHRLGLTLIEVMPLGDVGGERLESFVSLAEVRRRLERGYTLEPLTETSGGPARYFRVLENGLKLGLITPHSNNFCASCNRVRLTCAGRLYPCLGSDNFSDLKYPLRLGGEKMATAEIKKALRHKVEGHEFAVDGSSMFGGVVRHMSVTGG